MRLDQRQTFQFVQIELTDAETTEVQSLYVLYVLVGWAFHGKFAAYALAALQIVVLSMNTEKFNFRWALSNK